MIFIFILGMTVGLISPILRRYGRAAAVILAIGAAVLLAPTVPHVLHPDPRIGRAAIEANRKFELLVIGCELPVLALALISLRRFNKLYWVGYGIHAALTAWLAVVFVWLEFFWHW
jgi:hypothetical protein